VKLIREVIGDEKYIKFQTPYKLLDISKRIALKPIESISEDEYYKSFIDVVKYPQFIEMNYWIEMIEYELKCISNCLTYFNYLSKSSNLNFLTPLESTDICFLIDSSVNKFFSLLDRVAQFLNCAFSLGLVQDKLGPNGVTLLNINKELLKNDLERISECVSKLINLEFKDLKRIRNGITHHYHPLSEPITFVYQKSEGVIVSVNSVTPLKSSLDDILDLMLSCFHFTDGVLYELFNLMTQYYYIDYLWIDEHNVTRKIPMNLYIGEE